MKNNLAEAGAQFFVALLKDPDFLNALDPALTILSSKIANATAKSLQERHATSLVPPKDALIPVADCCAQIKKSWPTFKKVFITTGKLKLLPAPPGADKRKKYVSAKAWDLVTREVPMHVIRLKVA